MDSFTISNPIKEILLKANQLAENGTKEITLLGQNVNAYNFEKKKLSDLILEVSKISNIKKNPSIFIANEFFDSI